MSEASLLVGEGGRVMKDVHAAAEGIREAPCNCSQLTVYYSVHCSELLLLLLLLLLPPTNGSSPHENPRLP